MIIDNVRAYIFVLHFTDTLSTAGVPDGNQTLTGVMRVASLKAFNIFAPQINDVDMRSLYLRRAPARITGNKSFNNVHAADVHATALNGVRKRVDVFYARS